jgi:phage shock protein PspC (stress-responsive transcriptional regulator)
MLVGFAASSRTLRHALLFIYKLVGNNLKSAITLIKRYRNQKLIQFIIGIIWLIGIYFFVDSDIIRIGMVAFIFFIGIAYSTKLLTNIKLVDGFYIFETYSIVTQTEEIRISESQLTEILYNSDSLFNSHNLILKYNGTNGIVNQKLYLNAEPWSELTSDIIRIKNYCQHRV